jgi:hypothetical protein
MRGSLWLAGRVLVSVKADVISIVDATVTNNRRFVNRPGRHAV